MHTKRSRWEERRLKRLTRRLRPTPVPEARECRWQQAIVDHVTRYVGAPEFVLHEIKSELVHLDVHVVPPAPDRAFWFLFTTGMSARPMTVPAGAHSSRYAELSILLPRTWKLDRASWQQDSRWFWPIGELKSAALLPHRFKTWLGYGHTIVGAEPDAPYAPSTRLSSMVVLPPVSIPDEVTRIYVGDLEVELLTLWPLYPEELDYKLERGLDALIEALDEAEVDDVIDPGRRCAVDRAGGSVTTSENGRSR